MSDCIWEVDKTCTDCEEHRCMCMKALRELEDMIAQDFHEFTPTRA